MKPSLCVAIFIVAMIGNAGWALSESDQEGMDQLLADTMSAMTSSDVELWSLFSTQGSAAVVRTDEGFAAAGRHQLKTDEELAGKFVLPVGAQIAEQSLSRAGEFIMGRVRICAEVAASQGEVAGPVEPSLWDTFWREDSRFYIPRHAPGDGKPKTVKASWDATIAAIRDGRGRTWRLVSLALAPVEETTDQASAGEISGTLRAWERAFMQGDLTDLSQQLYDNPFCVAAYTPDGQAWFFTYPEYLTTMLASAMSMGVAQRSMMIDVDIDVSGAVGTATGHWTVDLPIFGSMNLGFTATSVKEDGRWLLVSLCGGMVEN